MNYFDKVNNKLIVKQSLPHNFLAEKMILSCILFNSEAIEITQQTLTPEAFYFMNHKELYRSFITMYEKMLPIDIVTLTLFLQENGLIEQIGGIKVLINLGNQAPSFSYLPNYIQIVKEKFLKRRLIRFGYKVIVSGYTTNQSIETILTKTESELFKLTNNINPNQMVTLTELLNNLFLELKEKFLDPKLPGLMSGFVQLDQLTQGFQKSDLIIIAGRPSMGKTALSLNMAVNCVKVSRLPILFCSLEMSKEQIMYRFLSSETGINQSKLKNGQLTSNDWTKLTKIMRVLAKLPFFIDDSSNLSTQDIRSKLKTILLTQPQIGLVIIDYLQLMKSINFKLDNRAQELSQITRDLKNLAREFNIPIIALSQLSRNVDNRLDQRPILSDLRESGSIEQDADLILMLSRSQANFQLSYSKQTQKLDLPITELIIAKQRNGPTGTIKLLFDYNRMQFCEQQN